MHERPYEIPHQQTDDSIEIPVEGLHQVEGEKSLAFLKAEAELLFKKLMSTGKIGSMESPYIESDDSEIVEAQHTHRLWQDRLFSKAGHDGHAEREAQFTDMTFFFDMGFRDPLDLEKLLESLRLFETSLEHTSDDGKPREHSNPELEQKVKDKIAEVQATLNSNFAV